MQLKVQKLTTTQLKDRLKRDRPYMLVDVREMEAYMKGHIPGASNIFDELVVPRVKMLYKGTDIILYGHDSSSKNTLCKDAAEKFMDLGSMFVYTYEEGLKGWTDGGNRVDHGERKMT